MYLLCRQISPLVGTPLISAGLLWLLAGMIFACTIVFTLSEFCVFLILHGRLSRITGERSRIIEPTDPITIDFPVGRATFSAPISKDNVTPLENAYSHLAPKLRLAGPAAALLSIAILYGGLVLLAPSSWAPSLALLTLPLMGFANSGLRGFVGDRRKFGEIYAFLNQLYIGGFTTVSFLVVALLLILKYLQIIP